MNIKLMGLALLASAFATSCSNNETEEFANSKVPMQFMASQEKIDELPTTTAKGTRTALQADGFSIKWQANDAIAVFPEEQDTPDKFIAKSEGVTTSFIGTTTSSTTYYALFPYNQDARFKNGEFYTYLPDLQALEDNNMANNANITIATLTDAHPSMVDNRLNFKNTCGMLKITFKYANTLSDDEKKKVSGISVMCRDQNEYISGAVKIGADGNCVTYEDEENFPSNFIEAGKKDRTPLTNGASYYIVVPAQTINNGIVVTLMTEDRYTYSVTVKKPIDFKKNKIQKLTLTVKGWTKQVDNGPEIA